MSSNQSLTALTAAQATAADLNNRILRLTVQKESIEQALRAKEAQGISLYGTSDPEELERKLKVWDEENAKVISDYLALVAQVAEMVAALEAEVASLNVSSVD